MLDPVGAKLAAGGRAVKGAAMTAGGAIKDNVIDPVGAKLAAGGRMVKDAAMTAGGAIKDNVIDPVGAKLAAAGGVVKDNVIDPAAKFLREEVWETEDMKWARKAGRFFELRSSMDMVTDARKEFDEDKDGHVAKLRTSDNDDDVAQYLDLDERLEGDKRTRYAKVLQRVGMNGDEGNKNLANDITKVLTGKSVQDLDSGIDNESAGARAGAVASDIRGRSLW